MTRTRKWLPARGFDGYTISDDGLMIGKKGTLLKGSLSHNGYRFFRLCRAGSIRNVRAARLVLTTFVCSPFEGAEASHLNGLRTDDRVENLQWKSHLDNEADKLLHGTAIIGEKSHLAKMTDAQAAEAMRLWETGEYKLQDLGELFGVTRQAIWALKEGRSRKNVDLTSHERQ